MGLADRDLSYPVYRYMMPVETSVRMELTVAAALASLPRKKIEHPIVYFYVIDDQGKLVGVVPTRKLLLAHPEAKIEAIMQKEVVSVAADTSLEMAMELFAMYRFLALPVVDDRGCLIGTVDVQLYAEEAADLAEANRQNELFQLLGMRMATLRMRSAPGAYRLRMPWLVCNILGGLICAVIGALFEQTLQAVVVLAMFIPLVLTLSESISMQSMTLGLQFLQRAKVPWPQVRQRLATEWQTAALIGLTSGVAVGLVSLLWRQGPSLAAVIALSILGSMVVSAVFGLMIPVSLHALKLDPKLASGPVVLMVTDVTTTLLYLALAAAWL